MIHSCKGGFLIDSNSIIVSVNHIAPAPPRRVGCFVSLLDEYMQKIKGVNFKDSHSSLLYGSRLPVSPLYSVIQKLVLPNISPPISPKYYVTCHNGVRCDGDVELEPKYVYVPVKDVLQVFDGIYDDFILTVSTR